MISQIRIKKARNANLCEYLIGNGCTLVKEGRQFRVKGTPGLVVMDNYWYDHAQQRGGNAIDYVIQIEGAKFKDAVAVLEEYCESMSNCNPSPEDRHDAFKPPLKNDNNMRLLSYLVEERGIQYSVLLPHINSGCVYEAYSSHNCVFTGVNYDTNEVRYAFQRSSLKESRIMFESSGSDKRYSFSILGLSDTVFAFESVIDLFSYLSMEPGEIHNNAFFLSLGGLGSIALDNFLNKWNRLRKIVFCIDSDSTADDAYVRLGAKYVADGYNVSRHMPVFKDWNLQLTMGGNCFPNMPVPWRESI